MLTVPPLQIQQNTFMKLSTLNSSLKFAYHTCWIVRRNPFDVVCLQRKTQARRWLVRFEDLNAGSPTAVLWQNGIGVHFNRTHEIQNRRHALLFL